MSRIHFPNLDVKQGFDFKKDFQVPHGFLKKLKIGTVQLKEDFKVKGPDDGADIQCVGVISHFSWNGGKTDQMEFHLHLSQGNQQLLNELTHDKMLDTLTEYDFVIFKYDAHAKKYYKAVFGDAALKGIIEKDNGNLSLAVAAEAHPLVQSPMNYHAIIHMKPQPEAQKFNIAVGDGKKMTTAFGVAETH